MEGAAAQMIATAQGAVQVHDSGGDGPAVLFVHGTPGGADQGALMGGFLAAAGFRVVSPSRPGFLDTPLDDDRATPAQQAELHVSVLDALGLGQVSVMCWSGGGPSSYTLAATHPDRVRSLVALAAVSMPITLEHPGEEKMLFTRPGTWLMREMARHSPKSVVKMMTTEEGDLPKDQAKALVESTWVDEDRRRFVLSWVDTVTGRRGPGFANDLVQLAGLDLDLAAVAAPTLLVHADTDSDVPFEHSRHAHEHLPDSTLHTIEGGTHISVWAGPDEGTTQQLIIDALRR